MRSIFLSVLLCFSGGIMAQTFTERLTHRVGGQGTVVLYQDPVIEDLVNGPVVKSAATPVTPKPKPVRKKEENQLRPTTPKHSTEKEKEADEIVLGDETAVTTAPAVKKTYRKSRNVKGFRIQLYVGDDSRQSRQKAIAMGNLFKSSFPDVPVYTHFYSPRWICLAGDFRTHEEANACLRQIKETGAFHQASIINCMIQVGY